MRVRKGLLSPGQLASLREAVPLESVVARDVKLLRKGAEFTGLCPFHSERTPSFYVVPRGRFFHCFGCGAHGDVIEYVRRTRGLDFRDAVAALDGAGIAELAPEDLARRESERARAEAERRRFRVEAARAIWRAAQPIAGTQAEAYLRARGIRIVLPPTLRFHPGLKLKGAGLATDRVLPALVAGVQSVRGRVEAVHRIWLGPDSVETGKAVEKRLLGETQGGAVRLAPAGPEMITCEGIETGLALAQALPDWPVWAGIDTTHMAAVVWPEEVERLTIGADRDPVSEKPGPMQGERPGEFWARIAAERFIASRPGRAARIAVPEGEKADFNDVLLQGAA